MNQESLEMSVSSYDVTLTGDRLHERTFLLGNDAGFVLYLPVEQNHRDARLLTTKWFGVSEFGRKYLEACRVWVAVGGRSYQLDRENEIKFVHSLDQAERVYRVGQCTVRQRFWGPEHVPAFVMTLEADRAAQFTLEPEFDMRYYQAFNTRFTGYAAEVTELDSRPALHVSNQIEGPSPQVGEMRFYCLICSPDQLDITLTPEDRRLQEKTYLADEYREKRIERAYPETHEQSPDEAPIWNTYGTTVYEPAHLSGQSPLTLVFAFNDRAEEVPTTARQVLAQLPQIREDKARQVGKRLSEGAWSAGRRETDAAYAQVFSRFSEGLVARDGSVRTGSVTLKHWSAIFAGNKYFLDAWKRDENISLVGLLSTNQYATVRAILNETWQYQDPRTGRLPHIIRLGEPLVYYSSDGTLWALQRLHEYTRMSGDRSLLDSKYPMVEHFFVASLDFVKRGLLPSGGIVDPNYRWETWEDTPYTPRDGYPVEIELLWLTQLANFLPVIQGRNPKLGERLAATMAEGRETFKLFQRPDYLVDSLGYDWQPRELLTPNGYIAFALDYPLPPELARRMVLLARDQLAGHTGVRSLAPRDWARVLSSEFLADPENIKDGHMASVGIYNYHRGIEWLWLSQFMVLGELWYGDTDKAYDLYVSAQVHEALWEGGVGGLSELYDVRGGLGADFQAWSMAGFIAALHAFSGVTVDALERCVQVRPSIPHGWPQLQCRRRVGDTRFDLRYLREEHTHRMELRALDAIPDGYRLRLGIRLAPMESVEGIVVNGETRPNGSWAIQPGPTLDAPGTVWIECTFGERTLANVHLAGS